MMGVDRTDYLMVGAEVGTGAFDWDKHQDAVQAMTEGDDADMAA